MGVYLEALLFWGFCFNEDGASPWQQSADEPDESPWEFETRLQRRSRALGVEPPGDCVVSYYSSFDEARFCVAIESSMLSAEDTGACALSRQEPAGDWRERLECFCRLLDIPFQEPGWVLTSRLIH